MKRIHPEPRDYLETQNWSSQRQLTDMGSQFGISSTIYLQPPDNNKKVFRAKTVKNFIQIQSTTTISPSNSTRIDRRQQFHRVVKKVMNALKFIDELKNYADQLKNQSIKYQYRKRNWLPLFPDDQLYIFWGLIINLCTDIAAILYPLSLAFNFEELGQITISVLQGIFWIDIAMHFIMCQISKQLDLIYKFDDIAYYYITGWFFIDLISLFPDFDLIGLKPLKLVRLLRFFFYERRVNYNQSIDLLKQQKAITDELIVRAEYTIDLRIKKLLKIFLEMIILNHLFACLWLWICQFNQYNWLVIYDVQEQDDFTKFLHSFFWAYQTITVIGYGDISASNFSEYLLEIIWMLIGVGYYSFTIGNITFILIQSNPNQEFDEQLINIEDITEGMPSHIQENLINFAKYNNQCNPFWSDDSKRILSELPYQLTLFTMASVHKEIFRNIPFIANDINFSAAVLPYSTLSLYQQYETIYHIDQNANEFFFLIKGDVRLCDTSGQFIIRVMEGTCFGEIEVIEYTSRRWSAHALQDSVILMCPAAFFSEYLQNESPQFFELQQMYKRRKIILYEQARIKRQKLNKIRRGHAVDEQKQLLNKKNTLAQQIDDLKEKIDMRPYHSVLQDLMLQIVGQKQARVKIIIEKFINAVNKVKYYVQKSKKLGKRLSVNDSDYRIIRSLINNRIMNSAWSKQISKKFGRKLLSNFIKVCDDEELIKQFLQKSKQESVERIMRKQFVHLVRNITKQHRKEQVDSNKIDLFYSRLHQQIFDEVKQQRQEERKKQKQRLESQKQCLQLKSQILNINLNMKTLQRMQTQISMSIFEITQHEYEIDNLINQFKEMLQSVKIF